MTQQDVYRLIADSLDYSALINFYNTDVNQCADPESHMDAEKLDRIIRFIAENIADEDIEPLEKPSSVK